MKLIPILMLSILLGAGVMTPQQANAGIIVISLGLTGGDCNMYGGWNLLAATCTLTTDLTDGVDIADDGITLDCDGHSITEMGASDGNTLIDNAA